MHFSQFDQYSKWRTIATSTCAILSCWACCFSASADNVERNPVFWSYQHFENKSPQKAKIAQNKSPCTRNKTTPLATRRKQRTVVTTHRIFGVYRRQLLHQRHQPLCRAFFQRFRFTHVDGQQVFFSKHFLVQQPHIVAWKENRTKMKRKKEDTSIVSTHPCFPFPPCFPFSLRTGFRPSIQRRSCFPTGLDQTSFTIVQHQHCIGQCLLGRRQLVLRCFQFFLRDT